MIIHLFTVTTQYLGHPTFYQIANTLTSLMSTLLNHANRTVKSWAIGSSTKSLVNDSPIQSNIRPLSAASVSPGYDNRHGISLSWAPRPALVSVKKQPLSSTLKDHQVFIDSGIFRFWGCHFFNVIFSKLKHDVLLVTKSYI